MVYEYGPYRQKLNANCKQEEKTGEGPGSCGGSKETLGSNDAFKSTAHIKEENLPNGHKYYKIIDSNGNMIGGVPQNRGGRLQAEKDLRRFIKKEEVSHNKISISNIKNSKTTSEPEVFPETQMSNKITEVKKLNKYNFIGTNTDKNATLYNVRNKNIIISNTVKNILPVHVENIMGKIPTELIDTIQNIEITDDKHHDNPNVLGTYSNQAKTITIYGSISNPKKLENTLYHEIGHQFDNEKGYKHYASQGDVYKSAIKNDGKGFITSYSKNQSIPEKQLREDFADSFREYIKDEKKFYDQYPNRANFFRNKLNDMKQNSYLDEVVDFMKQNYNCPESEKTGEGPGSCGGNKEGSSKKDFVVQTDSTSNDKFMWKELADKLLSKGDAEKYTKGMWGANSDRAISGLKKKISEELNKKGYNGLQLKHRMDNDFNRNIELDPDKKTPELVPFKPEPIIIKKEIKFIPAKDIKEAESFSESLIDPAELERVRRWNSGETAHLRPDQVQQIKLVSLRGIDIKVANVINKQIAKNISMGLPRPRKIIATQMKKTPNTLMRINQFGDLELNTIAMGKMDRVNEELIATRKLNGKEGKDAMASIESHLSTMTSAQKATYESIKEGMKYQRGGIGYEIDSTPERALEATINHEIGHTLKNLGKYAYGTPQHEEFRDAVKEMTTLTLNTEYKYKLSEYGCNPKGPFKMLDPEETFAELYAAYRFHEDDNIHPDALKLLKKYLER